MKTRSTATLLASVLLAACSGGGSDNAAPGYGDAPAKSSMSADGLTAIATLCQEELGSVLNWTDPSGEARSACLLTPPGATMATPLPMIVWLHPSLAPQDSVLLTGLFTDRLTADLGGSATGFVLLLPAGRDTAHYYPVPDNVGLGWDNWYRNLDRSSPSLNVDVAAIDHFIAAAVATGVVDTNRIYLSGWSNGAAMAQLYALNTPGIAAAAVYSSPDPFSDVQDPGAQAPFASNLTPLMDIHNQCDIIGICQTGTAFHQHLATRYPGLVQNPVIISELFQQVDACDASCAGQDMINEASPGTVNHLRWPVTWNAQMYAFMKAHPLH
ncbi:MAG TPA: PHB depolymerase family esterase [Nevskiaceae bacterium]|nr:PHB depolymerase family esterase [Nevskiaceae bacterium]